MIPGSEEPPPDLDTTEIFGSGFEGLLESINEIGNEAGKLVGDAVPMDIFALDQMAEEEEEQARIAEENAEEDLQEEVVHHEREEVQHLAEGNERNGGWEWNTPVKGGETDTNYTNTQVEEAQPERGRKAKKGKKKSKTKKSKKELDFFGFGGGGADESFVHPTAVLAESAREGDVEAGSFPVATPQFDSRRKRFEEEEDGESRGNNNDSSVMDMGVSEALGITSGSLSSLLPQRLMAGVGLDTHTISSFFDTEVDEDEEAGEGGYKHRGDPLLEQVQRNKEGNGASSSSPGSAGARSPGEVMASIRSFDTQAAFRKYQGAREELRRLTSQRGGAGGEGSASGSSGGLSPSPESPIRGPASTGAGAGAGVEAGGGWTVTCVSYRVLTSLLQAVWFLLASLINLVLLGVKSKYRLPTSLVAFGTTAAGDGASGVPPGGYLKAAAASSRADFNFNNVMREWGVACVNKTWAVLVTPTGASLVVFTLLLLSYLKILAFLKEMG